VPFEQVIPPEERDPELLHKLTSEAPGILNWMIAGCWEWQRTGLRPPEMVLAATARYREDMDVGDGSNLTRGAG
jgi:putative DNA primase/helicase